MPQSSEGLTPSDWGISLPFSSSTNRGTIHFGSSLAETSLRALHSEWQQKLKAISASAAHPLVMGTLDGTHAAPDALYREMTRFACSVPWRISPSRLCHLAGDSLFICKAFSNVYWNSELGCSGQSNESCWCHIKRDVHSRQSVGIRQARPNANKFTWSSVQHFICSWLIT